MQLDQLIEYQPPENRREEKKALFSVRVGPVRREIYVGGAHCHTLTTFSVIRCIDYNKSISKLIK